jgi:hypothetical protein
MAQLRSEETEMRVNGVEARQRGTLDCPPESGGQRDREADPAGGGSHNELLRPWNHPSHDFDFVSIVLPS